MPNQNQTPEQIIAAQNEELQEARRRIAELESQRIHQTNISQLDLEHVLGTKRTISASEGWALVDAKYLGALLILEERVALEGSDFPAAPTQAGDGAVDA